VLIFVKVSSDEIIRAISLLCKLMVCADSYTDISIR